MATALSLYYMGSLWSDSSGFDAWYAKAVEKNHLSIKPAFYSIPSEAFQSLPTPNHTNTNLGLIREEIMNKEIEKDPNNFWNIIPTSSVFQLWF